ncbi:hypothetical protein QUA71_26070 [Microcoleus sp. MON1_C5]|uniref:hypothetical protein n=1 Tax=Microcoleus sp. MON1_C5 TaxID=2818828 RepID=UPI002FD60F89
MGKNEIHARLSPSLMESLKIICTERECNLSDVVRAALRLYLDACDRQFVDRKYCLIKSQDNLEIQLIEASFVHVESSESVWTEESEREEENIIEW